MSYTASIPPSGACLAHFVQRSDSFHILLVFYQLLLHSYRQFMLLISAVAFPMSPFLLLVQELLPVAETMSVPRVPLTRDWYSSVSDCLNKFTTLYKIAFSQSPGCGLFNRT